MYVTGRISVPSPLNPKPHMLSGRMSVEWGVEGIGDMSGLNVLRSSISAEPPKPDPL